MKPTFEWLTLAAALTIPALAGCSPDAPIGADAGSASSSHGAGAGPTTGRGGASEGAAGAGGQGGSSTSGGGGPTCIANAAICDGACVDLARDADHCGACDRACPHGQSCSFGLCAVPCEGTLGFPDTPLPTTGHVPVDVALFDLDHDGNLDLVTLDQDAGAVRVRLGLGDGRFGPALDSFAWPNPGDSARFDHFAFADVDGDGNLDAVLTHHSHNEIVSLLGNGDGTFRPPISTSVHGPTGVALGDLDGDGNVDAVVINHASGWVGVMLGAGDGSFSPTAQMPSGTGINGHGTPSDLALADVDGDGALDLVVSNGNGELVTLLGRSDGTFDDPISFDLEGEGLGLALVDFDGDGILDAVVGVADQTRVLRGQGDGTFTRLSSSEYGGVQRPVIADVDGDGLPDVLSLFESYDEFVVLRGLAGGMLEAAGGYPSRGRPSAIAVGDVNGDGRPDVITNGAETDVVGVTLNAGDGTFPDRAAGSDNETDLGMTTADVNGDGILDLAVTHNFGPEGSEQRIDVHLGRGDGSFGPAVGDNPSGPGYAFVHGAEFVDVDGDGHLDLVSIGSLTSDATQTSYGLLRVRLGAGDGTFGEALDTHTIAYQVLYMVLADVNGDGVVDAIVPADVELELRLGRGDGTFMPATTIQTNGDEPTGAVAGDWNGDGAIDLAVRTGASSLLILMGAGDGTFEPAATLDLGIPSTREVAAGDMNGDGVPDLVVRGGADTRGSMMVLLGRGDGAFDPPIASPALASIDLLQLPVQLADLDGDGNLDVVFAGGEESVIYVMRGLGDGALLPQAAYPSPAQTWAFTIGDMNGDGVRDIAAVGGTGLPIVLTNRCAP